MYGKLDKSFDMHVDWVVITSLPASPLFLPHQKNFYLELW